MATIDITRQEMRGEHGATTGARPYGARFITRLRELGASLGSLRHDDIKRIELADRKGLVRILKRRHSMLPHRLVQGIEQFEPEDLATAMHHDRQMMWAFLLLALS